MERVYFKWRGKVPFRRGVMRLVHRIGHWFHEEWVHATVEVVHICHVVYHAKIMMLVGMH